MKKIYITIIAALFLAVIVSFASAIHEVIPSETQIPMPGADAGKLNEYIIRYKPYTMWNLWPGKGRLYKGTEPHGSLLTTFVNDSAYYSIANKKPFSDGAIIAKENYDADKKFVALTVMYKIRGYNPDGGDWFWAKYAQDGKVLASGKVKGCLNCHSAKKDNDFIFTGVVAK